MFNFIDIITIIMLVVLLLFLFIFLQFEKNYSKPRIYLRFAIIILIFTVIIEELTISKLYSIVIWAYPLYISMYFMIYPLIYLYIRELVLDFIDKKPAPLFTFFILPFLILIFVLIIYIPLDYQIKILFVTAKLYQSEIIIKVHCIFKNVVFVAYYLQVIFYLLATLKLYRIITNNSYETKWRNTLKKYMLLYVMGISFYEVSLLLVLLFLPLKGIIINTIEQVLTLLVILFGLYIEFEHYLIMLRIKIDKYTHKIRNEDFIIHEKEILSNEEKHEIRKALENYILNTKIYLDPNLKIEDLAKKIHISVRKLSATINQVFKYNFNRFINEYRITEAKGRILENPEKTVIDKLYMNVGFNSRSAFNHAFKESTGKTPAEFIQEVISKKTTV